MDATNARSPKQRFQRLRSRLATRAGGGSADPLLRKLRAKFIALNMGLAAVVLAVASVAICVVEHINETERVYAALEASARGMIEHPFSAYDAFDRSDAYGTLGGYGSNAPGRGSDGGEDDAAGTPSTDNEAAAPEIGGAAGGPDRIPIAVYVLQGNTIQLAPAHSTAAVPNSLLAGALSELEQTDASQGYLPGVNLFFARQDAIGGTALAFADGSAASSWHTLAATLALVGVGALVILLLVNLKLSQWALRPVQQAWTQQRRFVADASHELKTPLTVILANNAILNERLDATVGSQKQWIDSTQAQALRMQNLVSDMLELARGDAEAGIDAETGAHESGADAGRAARATGAASTTGATGGTGAESAVDASGATDIAPGLDADATPTDFSRVVEGAALTFESVAYERGLSLRCDAQEGVMVNAEAERLQRLMGVLLDNACKYADEGGWIRVTLSAEGRWCTLAVSNSGPVIGADELERIFDRFYRIDEARARSGEDPGGFGLGLPIAQEIATSAGGAIDAKSSASEGTTFTVRLPLA